MKLELQDYVALFESEPEWVHEQGWFYGARFSLKRGGDFLSVTVAPDEAEFCLEWRQEKRRLAKFNLIMVTEWRIERRGDVEQLLLSCALEREVFCIVTLRPEIAIEMITRW